MKNRLYRYYVTGPYAFPEDMLRYDRAVIIQRRKIEASKTLIYALEGKSKPTLGRWQSFLWVVIDTEEERARWGLPDPALIEAEETVIEPEDSGRMIAGEENE